MGGPGEIRALSPCFSHSVLSQYQKEEAVGRDCMLSSLGESLHTGIYEGSKTKTGRGWAPPQSLSLHGVPRYRYPCHHLGVLSPDF